MHTVLDGKQRSILIVEDSAFEQRMLMDMLSAHPYRLSVAFNGQQGYQLAVADPPDLILLDVRMPNMDGYTACRLLKAHPATQDIPIIFLSSNDGDDERILALSIGGVDFVAKPFSPGELAARIQVHLGLMRRPAAAAAGDPAAGDPAAGGPAAGGPAAGDLAAGDPDAVTVAAAKRLIVEHLADLPSLAEIARQVGTHREKLSQVFRQQTGATVFAYIREERIRRGEQLLRDTDMEVQDIAMLIGFHNAGNFATAFRARTGVTPSAFRQVLQRQPG